MRKINKRKVAWLLAACVCLTTLSPALPAFADLNQDKIDSEISLYAGQVDPASTFTVETINGTILMVGSEVVNNSVKTGVIIENTAVPVEITAPEKAGFSFKEWRILIGGPIDDLDPYSRTCTFTMPNQNVVLAAVYKSDPLASPSEASPSNAQVYYTVNADGEGKVALDLSEDNLADMENSFTTADDRNLIDSGRDVAYEVKLTKRVARASESNAAKAERNSYDDAFEAAWALDVDLLKHVEGHERPINQYPTDEFYMIAQVDEEDWYHLDYQLWRIEEDGSISEVLPLEEDPNDPNYGGVFRFKGKVTDTYVLTYSKTKKVTIENLKDVTDGAVITMRRGSSLSAEGGWTPANREYTDASGKVWVYKGLSTKRSPYTAYSQDTEVNKDITVYAFYEEKGGTSVPDPKPDPEDELQKAKDKLQDLINDAKDKLNDTSLSQSNRDKLENAIKDAEAILNDNPTVDNLNKGYDDLKAVLDSLQGSNVVIPPGSGGSGSSGGGGGGGSSRPSGSSSRYPSYVVGTDGNWNLIDADNHKWVFTLNNGSNISGTWAQLRYTYEGQTITYWYHFAADGIMDSGWFKDTDGTWYYLSIEHDGWFGHMVKGWHHDQEDGKWYYLDPTSGAMRTGWNQINNVWYFFNVVTPEYTWNYNETTKRWEYIGNVEVRPYGSMYAAETTPDNYQVDANGAWIR